MKTLAFINLKGGVGKTVSAANMAHILAVYHHKKVLLVDGDKQGSASRYFGMYGEQAGTEALLMQLRDAAEVIYPTQYKGLDIITSNLELYKADRMMYDSEADEDMAMRLYVRLGYVKNDYDFCIIDNGPSVDTVTLNVLAAADDVLIPIRPDEFSFSGLLDLVEQVNGVREAVNAGLTLRGAFFTHWQNRETFWQARRSLEDSGICPVFKTAIGYNPKVPESTMETVDKEVLEGIQARVKKYIEDFISAELVELAEEEARELAEAAGVFAEITFYPLEEIIEAMAKVFNADINPKRARRGWDFTTAWDRKEAREKRQAVERATAARFRQYRARESTWAAQKRTGQRRREWRGPWRGEKTN